MNRDTPPAEQEAIEGAGGPRAERGGGPAGKVRGLRPGFIVRVDSALTSPGVGDYLSRQGQPISKQLFYELKLFLVSRLSPLQISRRSAPHRPWRRLPQEK
jgi:hypothetical protein